MGWSSFACKLEGRSVRFPEPGLMGLRESVFVNLWRGSMSKGYKCDERAE